MSLGRRAAWWHAVSEGRAVVPLLLLLACAPRRPAAEPVAPAPVAEPAPERLPVARTCEEVVTDDTSAVDLAEVPAIATKPRRLGDLDGGPPSIAASPPAPTPRVVTRTPPVEPEWPPQTLPDGRLVVIARLGRELWLVDEPAASCLGRTDGYVSPFLAPVGDGLGWTAMHGTGADRDWELHWTDLGTGADRLLGTVVDADMVLLKPVPGEDRLVAIVHRVSADRAAFYDVPRDGAIRRIGPEVPSGPDAVVGAGAAVAFAIEPLRAGGAPSAPVAPDDDDDGPACDPIGCPAGACGWFPDHCGGRVFCGECPADREVGRPTTRGGYAFGWYVVQP